MRTNWWELYEAVAETYVSALDRRIEMEKIEARVDRGWSIVHRLYVSRMGTMRQVVVVVVVEGAAAVAVVVLGEGIVKTSKGPHM